MHTLLIRLAGPMQSWGTQSRFTERDTGLEPSKSGVVGLICAALGRPRNESVNDLATLRMGVRVDREGVMRRDYHTALNVAKADGSRPGTVVSNRYYLADADFLVGLEGSDIKCLEAIEQALRSPVWPLSLGRKSFPPGRPVGLVEGGVRNDTALETALKQEPWQPRSGETARLGKQGQWRAVLEVPYGTTAERRNDQPIDAAFATRQFLPRSVRTEFWTGIPKGEATHV
ncbi:type I-E CRISPR-associated protein Cas5/CasD [soil metagenome]